MADRGYSVPLLKTFAAACGGGVLGNENRMVFHGGLLAVIWKIGGSQAFINKICRVLHNLGESLVTQILKLLTFEIETGTETGLAEP